MNINIEKLKKLNELSSLSSRKRLKIVLNPEGHNEHKKYLDEDIIDDEIDWKIPEELNTYVDMLSKDENLSTEDKILKIYERICKDYVYDDNLISYIKQIDKNVFDLPDWYGRSVDEKWEKNRESHNRRVCYELSRYLAKSLTELFKDNDDYNICIFWNKNLTHYFVGLSCSDYTLTLDPDDFFNIKDLTRLKAGLTAQGISILEDNNNIFKNALDEFNKGKSEYAIKKIEEDINAESQNTNATEEIDDIEFLKKALQIASEKYNLDSQGIYEYMKEISDIRIGAEKRKKVLKRIEGKNKESTREIRCFYLNLDDEKFLIDVDEKIIRPFSEDEFKEKRPAFEPYVGHSRDGFDYYDGT